MTLPIQCLSHGEPSKLNLGWRLGADVVEPFGAGRNEAVPAASWECMSVPDSSASTCLFCPFCPLSCFQMLKILIYLALWAAVRIHSVIICSQGKVSTTYNLGVLTS